MNKTFIALLMVFFGLIYILLGCVTTTCVFWGLGVLIVKVFKINYVWTFWHGLCVAIVLTILKCTFEKGN